MIVFNLLAIVVGLIIGIVLGPLYWLFPTFMESTWGSVLACGLVTVIGIVTDLVGLKGRLFWLPIWVFGLLGMGVNLHTLWGWWGPGLAAALVVLLFGGLLGLGAVSERKEWAEAPGNLNAARDAFARGNTDAAWEQLGKAYSVPSWGDDTPERCRHNLEVLAVARQALPEPGSLELKVFDALALAYRGGGEKVTIPSEFSAAMQELLGNKGVLPEDEERAGLLEELDKPVTA